MRVVGLLLLFAGWAAGWTPLTLGADVPGGEAGAVPYVIDVWDTDDGLPQNSVTALEQTRDGYLWMGTLAGLVRFDGIRFSVFDESNTPGLTSSRVLKLLADREGTLWIGTETGGILNLVNGVLSSSGIGEFSPEQRLVEACQDGLGAVWLRTFDGQLWRSLEGKLTSFLLPTEIPRSANGMIVDSAGVVWVGSANSLVSLAQDQPPGSLEPKLQVRLPIGRLDLLVGSRRGGFWLLADGRVRRVNAEGEQEDWGEYPWGYSQVTSGCEGPEGNLIVGTQGKGMFWYSDPNQATQLSTEQGLSYDYILSLFLDREANLWVGTDGRGLNRIKRPVFEPFELAQGQVVQSVGVDPDQGVWVGFNGGGVLHWDVVQQKATRYGPRQGLPNVSVKSILADRAGRVWIGTEGGGLYLIEGARVRWISNLGDSFRAVAALHEGPNGEIWIGGRGSVARFEEGDWMIWSKGDGLPEDNVQGLAADGEGGVWIALQVGGIVRFRPGKEPPLYRVEGLRSDDVVSLYLDRAGVLWFGSFGGGLGRLEGNQLTFFGRSDGLPSNSVGYIAEDKQGYLWLGSYGGLIRVDKAQLNARAAGEDSLLTCRVYGKADGLPMGECTFGSQPAVGQGADGRFWFPTVNGVGLVRPNSLEPNPFRPPVVIESVLVDGQEQVTNPLEMNRLDSITIPAGRERLDIFYTSLNLRAPERSRFRYRLDGYEEGWTDAGAARVARYPRLPPGDYAFQVVAANEDGVWNLEGRQLAISVLPPFWRTAWFLSGSGLLLIAMIVGGVHYYSTQRLQRQLAMLRQEEALQKERTRIAQDIHDQLGANLTQVSFLSDMIEDDKDCPSEVEFHSRQIAQTTRETARALDEIVWAVNPANDSLEGLVGYICKHAQEYLTSAGLKYRLDVPAELPNRILPPEVRHHVFLTSKEAITNIVRHAQATAAWLRIRVQPDGFNVEIEDNGRGLADLDEAHVKSRNGLTGMRKRMAEIGGSFVMEPGNDGGTRVRLSIPFSKLPTNS